MIHDNNRHNLKITSTTAQKMNKKTATLEQS